MKSKKVHDPTEIICIVDEQDNVVGEEVRSIVHKKGILHREAAAFIINSKNEILLQIRTDNDQIDSSVAGHVPTHSGYLQTIVREINEEVGLDVKEQDLLEIGKIKVLVTTQTGFNNRFVQLYELKKDVDINELVLDPGEIKSIRFYSFEEIKELMKSNKDGMTHGLYSLLEMYFEKLNES